MQVQRLIPLIHLNKLKPTPPHVIKTPILQPLSRIPLQTNKQLLLPTKCTVLDHPRLQILPTHLPTPIEKQQIDLLYTNRRLHLLKIRVWSLAFHLLLTFRTTTLPTQLHLLLILTKLHFLRQSPRYLIEVALIQKILNQFQLSFIPIPTALPLFLNQQSKPVLQRVLRPSLKTPSNFRPLLTPLIVFYIPKQLHVLLQLPRPTLQTRTQKTSPVLTTLLCISIAFALRFIRTIQLLRNLLPLLDIAAMIQLLLGTPLHNLPQQGWLILSPGVVSQCVLLNAEPFEHARLSSDSRNEGGDKPPISFWLYNKNTTKLF